MKQNVKLHVVGVWVGVCGILCYSVVVECVEKNARRKPMGQGHSDFVFVVAIVGVL
jgi:hypothetical protein